MLKRFNRFELKYLITADQHEAIQRDLQAYMQPDANGQQGTYAITSLYYDTANLAFMRAKIEGIKFRRKLRIRCYGNDMRQPVLVEIKQRINRTTQKRRVPLALDDAYALCAGRFDKEILHQSDATVADEVLFLVRAMALQPTCLVGYQRQAWVGGAYELGLRVTFDHALWTALPTSGLSTEVTRHALVPPAFMVMEVKANEAVPMWLANLLARHQCFLTRYSKYCAGVARLDELELLSAVQGLVAHNEEFNGE